MKLAPIATRYVPKGATPVTRDDCPGAVAYVNETAELFYAVGYRSDRQNTDFNYRFRSRDRRDAYLNEWFDGIVRRAEQSRERSESRKAAREKGHPWQPGQIFHYSWGWEQTQCEFFEVVSVTRGTITWRRIASEAVPGSEGFMSERRVALPGRFLDDSEPETKVVQFPAAGDPHVSMKYGWCSPWDGKPEYCSWYA